MTKILALAAALVVSTIGIAQAGEVGTSTSTSLTTTSGTLRTTDTLISWSSGIEVQNASSDQTVKSSTSTGGTDNGNGHGSTSTVQHDSSSSHSVTVLGSFEVGSSSFCGFQTTTTVTNSSSAFTNP